MSSLKLNLDFIDDSIDIEVRTHFLDHRFLIYIYIYIYIYDHTPLFACKPYDPLFLIAPLFDVPLYCLIGLAFTCCTLVLLLILIFKKVKLFIVEYK